MSFRFTELALLLTLSGCFNPDDILLIRGTLEQAGQPLQLSRARNPFNGTCATDWNPLTTATSIDDGSFAFEVFRAYAASFSTMEPFCFKVDTTYPNGTHVSSTVEALYGETQLLPFPAWESDLRREGDGVHFTPLSVSLIGEFSVGYVVEVSRAGQTTWRTGVSPYLRGSLREDARVFDEFGGEASIRGVISELPDRATTQLENRIDELLMRPPVEVRSGARLGVSDTLVPPSRGATCAPLPSPCGLTDGELSGVELNRASSMTIQFQSPFAPTLVVLRTLVTSSESISLSGTQLDGGVVTFGPFILDRSADPPSGLREDGNYEAAGTFAALPLKPSVELQSLSVQAASLVRVDEVSVY